MSTKHSNPPVQGTTLFEETLRLTKIIPTGCKCVDDMLDGGIFTGEMTEIYGPPSAGKTQFALTFVFNAICNFSVNVLYIDTTASFNGQRLHDIIESRQDITSQQEMKGILERVHCVKIFDVFYLLFLLESIKSKLFSECDSFCLQLKVIVLDSIAAIISPLLGGKQTQGHALMAKVGLLLKEIAYEYGISILVLNNSVGNFNDPNSRSQSARHHQRYKPALGRSWMGVPHVRLFMDFFKDDRIVLNKRVLSIRKHPRSLVGKQTDVYISRSGLLEEND